MAKPSHLPNENRYEQQLWRYGTLAGIPQPHQGLDRLAIRIDHTQGRLDQACADLATLTREPALRTLPPDRLRAERDNGQATRAAQKAASARTRISTVRLAPTHDSLLPPPNPAPGIRR